MVWYPVQHVSSSSDVNSKNFSSQIALLYPKNGSFVCVPFDSFYTKQKFNPKMKRSVF
ncbi:hypothetical protein HMPREF3226_01479 [Prevotella corporis]|uniref:Uncharacterized protein n=1 Tax=Prevotella corporis TaxID=28128 RepID=A0A133Q6W0_9BACT|nr:hypothetical protein HMPREF3226_01479 [Prevotella corporis]